MFYGMQYIRYIPNSFFDNFTYTDRIYASNNSMFQGCYSLRKIPERVFEIMLENHFYNFDFCHDIKDCDECPFYRWDICPNLIKKEEE